MVVWTLGEMVMSPVAVAHVANLAPEDRRGQYMGAWGLTSSIGLMAGPALGGWIFSTSPWWLWVICASSGLLAALLILPRTAHREAWPARQETGA